jgi:hypothetical protein
MNKHFSTREYSAQQWSGTDPCSTGGHPQLLTRKKRRLQMNKFRFTIKLMTIAIFMFAFVSIAQAQATRTWVSGVGDDVNPCSRTAPCKTYAGAISKTAKDGEISTLDPGGFGAVTITKSITINGGGGGQGYGSILSALSPQGVLVNITDVNDIRKSVKLQDLNINGASTGTDGIRMIAGNVLHISNCTIDGLVGDGIDVNVTAAGVQVIVENTRVRNAVGTGIKVNGTSATQVRATISNSYITRNGIGVDFVNGVRGMINDSVVSNNTSHGLQVAEPTVGSNMNIVNVNITNNAGTGVNVVGNSRARIARCNIFENNVSLAPAARVDSGNNNSIVGNTTNTAPGGTPFPQN